MAKIEKLLKRLGYVSEKAMSVRPPEHTTIGLSVSLGDTELDRILVTKYPKLSKALLDHIATESPSMKRRLEQDLQKGISNALLSTMETIQSAYVAPSVSGIGPAKQMLTEWWFNPIWGQPRLVDLRTVKQLARGHIGSMAIEAILDQIMQVQWDIVPKYRTVVKRSDEVKQAEQEQRGVVKAFLDKPNRNNDNFDKILRMLGRNILETDDGTLVKVFDRYQRPQVPNVQMAGTGDIRQYTAQPAWDQVPVPGAKLLEVYAEDGTSFLKQTDMHGYLMNYWQYSFIVPRRPVRFETNEIVYISQNPRSGSPYGISPFESIVDSLQFVMKAMQYNEHFYENSAIPAFQIDYPWIKTPTELKEMGEYLESNFMGPDKAYRTLITNGGAKVQILNFDPEKLQMLEMQEFYIKLILAKLKVPADVLGISGNGGGAAGAVATQTAIHKSRAIKPLMTLIENALNSQLLPDILGVPKGESYVEFKWGEIVDLEEKERMSKIDQVHSAIGARTINEQRIRDGLDPVPWGDEPFLLQAYAQSKLGAAPGQQPDLGAAPKQHPFSSQAQDHTERPQGVTESQQVSSIGQAPGEGRSTGPMELPGGTMGKIKKNALGETLLSLFKEAKDRLKDRESRDRVIDEVISKAKGIIQATVPATGPSGERSQEEALKDFKRILMELAVSVEVGDV